MCHRLSDKAKPAKAKLVKVKPMGWVLICAMIVMAALSMSVGPAPSSHAQDMSEDDPLPRLSREQVEWIIERFLMSYPELIERALSVLV